MRRSVGWLYFGLGFLLAALALAVVLAFYPKNLTTFGGLVTVLLVLGLWGVGRWLLCRARRRRVDQVAR